MTVYIKENERIAEVICQHTRDRDIIPIKIKIQDEDKVYQEYKIREYRRTKPGSPISSSVPNEPFSTASRWIFECKIEIFGQIQRIYLFYNHENNVWTVMRRN